MDDAEISRRLALAIGWDVLPLEDGDEVATVVDHTSQIDRYFDYRDPAVIWPIAERYNCFPQKMRAADLWSAPVPGTPYPRMTYEFADTAAKAVALAVIKAYEGSKT